MTAKSSHWRVDVITTEQGFAALEGEWDRLSARTPVDHPFATFGWMRCWWNAFGAGHELHIVVVRDGRELVAIAPLMLTRGRLFGLRIRRMESMANAQTPRFDLLVARGAEAAYAVIWDALRRDVVQWDLLQLAQLPAGTPTLDELARLADCRHLPTGRWYGDASPYLVFDNGDADTYQHVVSRKHRANMDRLLRRLSDVGPVELEVVGSPGQLKAAIEDGFRLEGSGWKNRAGTAIVSHGEVEQFYRALVSHHAANGELRLLFLKSGDQRIAFAHAVVRRGALYLLKCGYDPAFSHCAPVHLLCHLLFRNANVRSFGTVEFLGANDEWKRRWTRSTVQNVWLFVFRDTWWTRLLCRTKFELVPHLKQQPAYRALLSSLRRQPMPGGDPECQLIGG